MTTATSGVLASLRFPWLLPVRNSFASYGASMCNGYKKPAFKGYPYRESAHPSSQKKPIVRKTCSKETHPGLQISFSFEQADPPVEAHSATGLTLLLILRCGHTSRFAHTCPLISFRITPCCCVLYRCSDLRSSQLLLDYAWAFASAHFASFPRVTACLRPGCMSQA